MNREYAKIFKDKNYLNYKFNVKKFFFTFLLKIYNTNIYIYIYYK